MYIRKNQKGASLLDTVFGTALLLLVFVGLYGAFQLTLELVQSSKSKTGALAIANERMEFIRSLPYDDIGTVGGIPQGALLEEESKTLNGIEYTQRTFVQYADAPQDGAGGSDSNGITTDYKIVRVTVEWQFRGETRSFFLVTSIVPKGIESVSGGGTLRVTVLDSLGSPIPSAEVYVTNTTLTPPVSLLTFTNTNGIVEFLGAPSANNYEVTVQKTNYSTPESSIQLPFDGVLLEEVERLAKQLRRPTLQYVVVIGIGGSNLGTQAIYDAIAGSMNLLVDRLPKLLFLDTVSDERMTAISRELSQMVSTDDFCLIAISKSGSTTESA